ncbi:aquaporin-like protein, partial [Microdochium trichocladiopsis]
MVQDPKGPLPHGLTKHRLLGRLPVSVKNQIVALIAEFVGTFMFLFFAFGGTQVVNGPANAAAGTGGITYAANDAAKLLYISLSFGMSLMVTAWVFFRISGGLFNPAVTLGLALVGVVTPLRAVLVACSQVLGGIAAAAVVQGLTPGKLNVNTKLLATANDVVGMDLARGLFMEMFMTAQLVFTVFMLAAEKHKATFIAPVGIGLSLFIAELMSVYYTGGSLNPARSFGPSVIQGFNSDHWVYWVGPILGSLVASGFYALAKAIKYETVNPNADGPADDEYRGDRSMSSPMNPGLEAGLGSW